MLESIECPQCGKKSVVQDNEGVYKCLACDFERDLSEPYERETDSRVFWASAAAAIFAFLILQVARYTASNISTFEYQSSTQPTSIQARTK